jgi:hypothetical protein
MNHKVSCHKPSKTSGKLSDSPSSPIAMTPHEKRQATVNAIEALMKEAVAEFSRLEAENKWTDEQENDLRAIMSRCVRSLLSHHPLTIYVQSICEDCQGGKRERSVAQVFVHQIQK